MVETKVIANGTNKEVKKLKRVNKKMKWAAIGTVFVLVIAIALTNNLAHKQKSCLCSQVKLWCDCPFWPDDGMCKLRDCSVCECPENEFPSSFRKPIQYGLASDDLKCQEGKPEAAVDRTLDSKAFRGWVEVDNPWTQDDETDNSEMTYVNLQLNPERYTGYTGPSARRIWEAVCTQKIVQNMVGGNGVNNGNTVFPGYVKENRVHYDINMLPQLQLFGHDLNQRDTGTGTINYMENEQAPLVSRPVKRVREGEPIIINQKSHISLNNNVWLDEAGNRTFINPNLVSTGLRLSCDDDEPSSSVSSASENMRFTIPGGNLALCNSLKMEIDQQNEDLGRYIKLQQENILKGVRELSQRHTVSLLNSLDNEVNKKLHEKELEIVTINRKNKELGDKINQVSAEAQSWHYRAKYNESVVNALKSNIQQLMAQGTAQALEGCGESEVDDAVSGTNNHGIVGCLGNNLVKCRACNVKEVSVLLLPCRHLCLCTGCEGFIDICPICQVMKNASVHVYM